jgi:hypothetical protein
MIRAVWLPPESQAVEGAVRGAQSAFPGAFTTLVSLAGGLGSFVAVYKTYAELFQSHSVLSERNEELTRASKLVDVLKQFANENLPPEQQQAFKTHIHQCLQESLARIDALNQKLALIRQDPNSTLTTSERMFLLFRPLNKRGWIFHFLTYMTVVLLGWYVFRFGVGSTGDFSLERFLAAWRPSVRYLSVLSLVFLFLLFRIWSLTERKREMGHRERAGKLAQVFAAQYPESIRMLIAQFLFFPSLLIALAAVVMVITSGVLHSAMVLVFGVFLFLAITFRNWAAAEFSYEEKHPQLAGFMAILFGAFFKSLRYYGLLRLLLVVAVLLTSLFVAMLIMAMRDPKMLGPVLVFLPMPISLSYALFRSLRIKYSMAMATSAQNTATQSQSASA